MSVVLVLGSGPNVVQARAWPRALFKTIVCINNAWAVRPDWDIHIHPDDFPTPRQPTDLAAHQKIVRADTYVPIQNQFGGFVYAGGTMAFTAAYWALGALRPKVIAMMGCDMVYGEAETHFYGTGTADPLRADISLRSLEAKSARLSIIAAQAGCAMVNLSSDESRLTFQRSTPSQSAACAPLQYNAPLAAAALAEEARLGYFVESGEYWKEADQFSAKAIDVLDALWLKAAQPL